MGRIASVVVVVVVVVVTTDGQKGCPEKRAYGGGSGGGRGRGRERGGRAKDGWVDRKFAT